MICVTNIKDRIITATIALAIALVVFGCVETADAMEINVNRVYGGSGAAVQIYQDKIVKNKALNNDTVGFIHIPYTNIQYPLVQADKVVCNVHGIVDQCYYMKRTELGVPTYGTQDSAVFVDTLANGITRSTLGKNTVIYGHNWRNVQKGGTAARIANPNDTMFGQLPSFSNYNFASGIPYFTIENGEESLTFLIFSVNYISSWDPKDPSGVYFWNCYPTDAEQQSLINYLQHTSEHEYHVPVDSSDKVVILQTCTYKYRQDDLGRFLVCGRLLRDGESAYDYPAPSIKTK